MIGNAYHDSATERLYGGGKRERERDSMRPDQSASSAAAERRHSVSYSLRWRSWEPWVRMAMNGDSSSERYDGLKSRHRERLLLLHQTLSIPMKIISRHALDDPRLSEPQMRERLRAYRERKQVYDSMKRKRGNNVTDK